MKAQITIEFAVAAIVFFSVVLYVMVYLNSNLSGYREDFYINNLQSRVMQISELLVNSREAGISNGYPLISNSSINSLNWSCRYSYAELLMQLDLKHHRIKIQINETETGDILVDCGPAIPEKATKVNMRRFGVLDTTNEIVTIDLWVW